MFHWFAFGLMGGEPSFWEVFRATVTLEKWRGRDKRRGETIERIEGMSAGTVGLRASGKLTKADYTDVLEPALSGGSSRASCACSSSSPASTASRRPPSRRT